MRRSTEIIVEAIVAAMEDDSHPFVNLRTVKGDEVAVCAYSLAEVLDVSHAFREYIGQDEEDGLA